MKQNANDSKRKPATFGDINAEASLWILLPKMFSAIVVSTALILLIFYLQFVELTGFAFGFAAFLAVLQILIILGLRFQNRADIHVKKSLQNDWLDKIGAWWLMACAFGALFGWICGQAAQAFPSYAVALHSAKVFFTIFLPISTMLPNLRYLEKQAAFVQIPLLFFVTSLPVLVGISSLFTLWKLMTN